VRVAGDDELGTRCLGQFEEFVVFRIRAVGHGPRNIEHSDAMLKAGEKFASGGLGSGIDGLAIISILPGYASAEEDVRTRVTCCHFLMAWMNSSQRAKGNVSKPSISFCKAID
jgi:hypothetical protein